jgi:hypothetical protein
MGKCGGGIALNNLSAHRITEELVDRKVLLKGTYSEVDQPAVRSIGTPDHWSGEHTAVARDVVNSRHFPMDEQTAEVFRSWTK